jgi:hypothetical protein
VIYETWTIDTSTNHQRNRPDSSLLWLPSFRVVPNDEIVRSTRYFGARPIARYLRVEVAAADAPPVAPSSLYARRLLGRSAEPRRWLLHKVNARPDLGGFRWG